MNISERDRRALAVLVLALIVIAVIAYWPEGGSTAAVADTSQAISIARTQLQRSKSIAGRLAFALEEQKKADASVANWDKRLISGDTPAQASAQLLTIFRRVARAQSGAIEMRSSDLGQVTTAGEYAEVAVAVSFDCQVEGLLNLLADLTTQPELLAWRDLRINSSDQKTKRLNVALTVLARAPKKLLPKATAALVVTGGSGERG